MRTGGCNAPGVVLLVFQERTSSTDNRPSTSDNEEKFRVHRLPDHVTFTTPMAEVEETQHMLYTKTKATHAKRTYSIK